MIMMKNDKENVKHIISLHVVRIKFLSLFL